MKYSKISAVSAATILSVGLMTSPTLAHTGGHGTGMMMGLAHPLLGLDHLLAMLAVGLWAAMRPAKMAWQGPMVFLAMILVGAVLGISGLAYSAVEPGILASVLLLGLMVATGRHLPASAGLAAIAVFAMMHGQAHGLAAGEGSGMGFVAGMLAMTAGLHLLGYGLGKRLHQFKYGAWVAGSVIAAGGLALITA